LTPSFFGVLFSTLSEIVAIWGMPGRRGRKHDVLEPPRAIDCFYDVFNKATIHKKRDLNPEYGTKNKKLRYQRIFDPGSTGRKGTSSDAESPAARIMPLLSTPNIFAGARLVTTTTSLPTSSSGL
jgi:hypothetical protein